MPDGLSSTRLPSRVSDRVVDPAEMSDLDDTEREFHSPPDIDQPPAPAVPVALTGSSNSTLISLSETAAALTTEGAWPSSMPRRSALLSPSALPDASASRVASMVSVPVALAAAASPSNVIVWVADTVPGDRRFRGDLVSPGESSRLAYADWSRETGSLYVMVSVLPAVMAPPSIVGAWPSASKRRNSALRPRALPDVSTSAVWFIVIDPVAFVATAAPSNVTVWVAEGVPVGPSGVRDPPGVRDRAE